MYYKTYPICVRFTRSLWDSEEWTKARTESVKKASEVKRWLRKCCDFDYRTRGRYDYHFAIYLKDIEALDKIYQRYKKEITVIEAPATESHRDMMIEDLNITVREKLFYSDYRYKISSYLYRNDMDVWLEMIDVIKNSFEEESYRMNPTLRNYVENKKLDEKLQSRPQTGSLIMRRWLPFSGTATVYLKEYDDVCTLHMMFKNVISSTTKIVLKSEL
jgi:hypothetical protein